MQVMILFVHSWLPADGRRLFIVCRYCGWLQAAWLIAAPCLCKIKCTFCKH